MPFDRSKYPVDWPTISRRVREEAGNRCEWCGVPNGAHIVRERRGWREVDGMEIEAANLDGEKVTRIVLTVAHLGTERPGGSAGDKHDKHDVRRENLAALCARCHLLFDLEDHVRHAAETRRRKRIAAGQQPLTLTTEA